MLMFTCPLQKAATREEKVDKMLELVGIKGRRALTAFCDALQMSGHAFIADFIRDEREWLYMWLWWTEIMSSLINKHSCNGWICM